MRVNTVNNMKLTIIAKIRETRTCSSSPHAASECDFECSLMGACHKSFLFFVSNSLNLDLLNILESTQFP